MKYRWKPFSSKDVLNRYFFNYSKNRSLFRNGMARLWWIGRVTYDERRSDPFELTKFLCNHQDFIETICGRSTFNNPVVQKATLNALYDVLKDNNDVMNLDMDSFEELSEYNQSVVLRKITGNSYSLINKRKSVI